MKRSFSLAYLTVPGTTPAAQTRIAARAGYDSVSLRLANIGLPDEPEDPLSPQSLRETTRALRETGLPLLDVELARIVRDRDARSYVPVMEAAAAMGAHHMISSAWTTGQNDGAFVVERYAELCDLARPFGLTIDLEFPTFSRVRSLAEAMGVVGKVNPPNGGILVDALYYHFSRCAPAELATLPKTWVHFIHLCDTSRVIPATTQGQMQVARENRLYAGDGCIDLAGMVAALPVVPLSIELPNARRSAELGHEGHARRCLETARSYFQRDEELPVAVPQLAGMAH